VAAVVRQIAAAEDELFADFSRSVGVASIRSVEPLPACPFHVPSEGVEACPASSCLCLFLAFARISGAS